jgi:hypothetical protein
MCAVPGRVDGGLQDVGTEANNLVVYRSDGTRLWTKSMQRDRSLAGRASWRGDGQAGRVPRYGPRLRQRVPRAWHMAYDLDALTGAPVDGPAYP